MGMALVAALGFVACADDDDVPGPSAGGGASGGAGAVGNGVAGQGIAGQGGSTSGEPASGAGAGLGGGAAAGAGAAGESAAGADGAGARSPGYGAGGACNGDESEVDQERVKLCVLLASCAGPTFEPFGKSNERLWTGACLAGGPVPTEFFFYSNRVNLPRPRVDARVSACPSSIDSCDDVLACAGYRNPHDECEDGSARCEGELAINCGEHHVVIDCERTTGQTGTCKVAGGRAVCDTGQACEPGSPAPTCDGDTLYRCEGGVSNGTDCAQFGLVCHQFDGKAACIPPLPSTTCTELDTPACDGSRRSYCSPDGLLFEHECNAPLSCTEVPGDRPFDRVGLECGCKFGEDASDGDTCEGDDLRLGTQGFLLHCPDYGFATCRGGVCADEP